MAEYICATTKIRILAEGDKRKHAVVAQIYSERHIVVFDGT
jgi:hypothetical protein